jgi:hypothetical protein
MEHERGQLELALELMQRALELIDSMGKAHDAGAHLDLAICRLKQLVAAARDEGLGRNPTLVRHGAAVSLAPLTCDQE